MGKWVVEWECVCVCVWCVRVCVCVYLKLKVGGGAINPAASWRARRKVESCKQQEADRAKTSVGKESEKTE